jgi:hypothetical protein
MLKDWVDRQLLSVSEWLWVRVPTKGNLAAAADAVAGGKEGIHLPKERIGGEKKIEISDVTDSVEKVGKVVGAVAALAGTVSIVEAQGSQICPDPYCYMHGYPCSRCGGSDMSCPPGTVQGYMWPGCCTGNNLYYYYDCCSNAIGTSNCWGPVCTNSAQPNWCSQDLLYDDCPVLNSVRQCTYVCTLSIPAGPCGPGDPGGVYS